MSLEVPEDGGVAKGTDDDGAAELAGDVTVAKCVVAVVVAGVVTASDLAASLAAVETGTLL